MSQSRLAVPCLALLLLLPGCAVRSISNTARPWGDTNTTYAGELSDFDVVGLGGAESASKAPDLQLQPHARVMVVQSGALFPDEPMLTGLAQHFTVGAASGSPSASAGGEQGMRLAAVRGGFDAIVAYWGVLESRPRPTAGKAAAWVPIAGFFVNDESQQMRIRLRIVVVDASTGSWRSLLPEPIDDVRASSLVTRQSKDSEQVELLKAAAYRVAVEQVAALVRR
ncbi:MAG TPA: hypothetical protein VF384_16085 [Planctomycetota bacterium]